MNSKLKAGSIAAFAGGLIYFLFTFLSYGVLPLHRQAISQFKNPEAVATVLKANIEERSMYFLPGWDPESKEATGARLMVFGVMQPASPEPGAGMFLRGLLIDIVVAALFLTMLFATNGLSFLSRAGYIVTYAFSAFVLIHLSNWNWWYYPLQYTFVELFDLAMGWGLAALAMSAIIKRAYED